MQSTSIQDFPPNFKRRLELQNQHNLQYQQLQQQQQEESTNYIIQEPPFKKHRPGIAQNLLCKFVELATYSAAFASDIKNTLTGGHSTRQNYDYDDETLQIDDDDYNKKDHSTWGENVEENEEEPPPPYDNSWSMPSSTTLTSTTTNNETKPSLTISTTSSPNTQQQNLTCQNINTTQSPTQSPTNSASRRRQIRVRRGRRILRRKSSSVDMSSSFNNSTSIHSENNVDEEEEDIFLKFNCKLTDMITEGKAALNSKVEVTEVEMLLAEEKEREERIMKEFGIQSPINRRPRTNFNFQNYNFNNNNFNYNNYLNY